MNRAVILIVGLGVIVAVGYFSYQYGLEQGKASQPAGPGDPFAKVEEKQVFALGRIEPVGGVINVGGIPGESLTSVWTPKGDDNTVDKGETLASLKGAELAAKNLEVSEANLERLKKLPADLASPQQIEQQSLAVQQAKMQLDRTRIKSPISGTVLQSFVGAGEMIGREPIVQIADLEHMVVVAEVYEMHVKRIELGQPAVIRSRAFHDPYDKDGLKGKVVEIGQMIASPQINTFNPLARADRHVVEVKIELDEESAKEAAKLINLEVEVEIDTKKDK